MSQKGEHTWDLNIHYHLCPHCQYINESRLGYEYFKGIYQKEVECERCHLRFWVKKPGKMTLGPFIGDPQPIETEWGDPE